MLEPNIILIIRNTPGQYMDLRKFFKEKTQNIRENSVLAHFNLLN